MSECDLSSFWSRLGSILSYCGSTKDVIINYVLVALNLIWCIIAIRFHSADIDKKAKLRRFAIGSLSFVVTFQIVLCLLIGCYGISIVWCAMGGWIVSERKRLRRFEPVQDEENREAINVRSVTVIAEMLVVLLDFGAVLYYAVVANFITFVAHVASFILGATLSLISIKLYDEDHGVDSSPSSPLMDKY